MFVSELTNQHMILDGLKIDHVAFCVWPLQQRDSVLSVNRIIPVRELFFKPIGCRFNLSRIGTTQTCKTQHNTAHMT